MERSISIKSRKEHAMSRLDRLLSEEFKYLSRTGWQREIIQGKVCCNGKKEYRPAKRIAQNTLVSYEGLNFQEPEVDFNYKLLYNDGRLMAIDKPGNLPVHPSGAYYRNTLQFSIEHELGRILYPVHRIDRETSGIVLFAHDPEIASMLHRVFPDVKKEYIALVHGCFPRTPFTVDMPIGDSLLPQNTRYRFASHDADEPSQTGFSLIRCLKDYSLIKAKPVTGRLHQIRVHLKYAGYPIVGDKLYGLDHNLFLEFKRTGMTDSLLQRLKFKRSALHAARIEFKHPISSKNTVIEAPFPSDITNFIETIAYG
jgi:RluA family pseudouridine synthase